MIEAIEFARRRQMFDLWAYVVMPEHVHLVILPRQEVRISAILQATKQSVSRQALAWLEAHTPRFLKQLEHVRADGSRGLRFWQRGGGYDRNLRSAEDVHEKIEYVHNNPVRRGLVSQASLWPWSSCHAWETGEDRPIAIDRESVPTVIVTQ